jgi:hypothetical protein
MFCGSTVIWDALVAFGTLALAAVTFFLAWSTRRLAVETATEVQAQWRPILVPVEGSIEMFERDLSEQELQIADKVLSQRIGDREVDTREAIRRRVEMTIRNIGRGPALDIMVSHLWEGPRPWTASSTNAGVIPADGEWILKQDGFQDERSRDLRLQYRDLSGRRYMTEIRASKLYDEAETINVKVTIGEPYLDPEIPRPSMADPLVGSRVPSLRGRLQAAGEVLWPPLYVEPVRPMWRRISYALSAMRVPSSATFSQRVRYGIGRGFTEAYNPEVPRYVPQAFAPVVIFWRKLKKSYRAFHGFRGVGIPPVGLYEDEWRTRTRIESAKRRVDEIARRRRRWS